MWSELPYRLDGTKEQCDFLYPPGPHAESKGAKSPFFYILALLHFDCGGQPADCCDYNCQ